MVETTKNRTLPSEAIGSAPVLAGLDRRTFTRMLLAGLFAGRFPSARAGEPPQPVPECAAPTNGAILVAGGGKLPPEIRNRLIERAGGKKARVVLLPTADADADDMAKRESFYWPGLRESVASVEWLHTHDRDTADTPAFSESLDDATCVWVAGGDQIRLSLAYAGTLVEQKLHAVLRRGGMVGGTSAGTSILRRNAIMGGRETAKLGRGFGLAPSQCFLDQHFKRAGRELRLSGLVHSTPGSVGFGIEEETALEIDFLTAMGSVLGNAGVWVYQPDGKKEKRKAGDVFDLRDFGISMPHADLAKTP